MPMGLGYLIECRYDFKPGVAQNSIVSRFNMVGGVCCLRGGARRKILYTPDRKLPWTHGDRYERLIASPILDVLNINATNGAVARSNPIFD